MADAIGTKEVDSKHLATWLYNETNRKKVYAKHKETGKILFASFEAEQVRYKGVDLQVTNKVFFVIQKGAEIIHKDTDLQIAVKIYNSII